MAGTNPLDKEEEMDWDGVVEDHIEVDDDEEEKPFVSPSAVDGLVGAFGEAEGTALGDAPKLVVRPAEELVQTVIPVAPKFSSIPTPVVPPPSPLPRPASDPSSRTQELDALEMAGIRAAAEAEAKAADRDPDCITAATKALVANTPFPGFKNQQPPQIEEAEGSGPRPIPRGDAPTVDAADADDSEQLAIIQDMVGEWVKKYEVAFGINLRPVLGVFRNARFKSRRLDDLEVQYVTAMVIRKLTEILYGADDSTPALFAVLISNIDVDLGVLRKNSIFLEIVNSMANLPIPQDTKYGEILAKVLMMVPPISRDDR